MQYLRDSSKPTHAVVQGIERVLCRNLTQPLNLPDATSVPDTRPLLLRPGLLSVVRSWTPIDCHRTKRTTARARPTDPAGRSRRHDGSIATLVHRVRTRRCYTGPTLPVHLVAWVLVDLGVWLLVPLHRGRTVPPPSRSTPCPGSWRDGFGGTTTVSTCSMPDWMHRLPSRTASGGHCVPAPEAVVRIASQRAHAQANAHSAAGSAASYSRSARPADILACVGSRTHHRIPGARRAQNRRAQNRRDHDLCMCLSNRKQHWPSIEQTRKFRILPRCPAECAPHKKPGKPLLEFRV